MARNVSRTLRTCIVASLSCLLVLGGLPAPALAEMVEEAAVEETADAQGADGCSRQQQGQPVKATAAEGVGDANENVAQDAPEGDETADEGEAVAEGSPSEKGSEEHVLLCRIEGDDVTIVGCVDGNSQEMRDAKLAAQSDGGASGPALVSQSDDEDTYVYTGPSAYDPVLVIPETIGGLPVAAIGDSAFEDAGWLEEAVLPAGLRSVGERAFYGCERLRRVSVPEGLQTVASWAFANCPKLAECALPEGVRYATEPYREPGSEWNGQYLFSGCTSLASYRVPASLGGVSYGMFQNCTSLASVEIPEGIGYVGGSAFSNCRALSAISLPEGLTSVGGSAFHGCSPAAPVAIPASLTEVGDGAFRWYVTYSSHSEWDEAAGEWVERREYSTPESYELRPATWEQYWRLRSSRYVNPDTTEVVAPEGAEPGELEWEWEDNGDGTATVTGCSGGFPAILSIPSEVGGLPVAAIGDSAFEDAGWLEEAVLPAGLRSVGERAFYGCERLRRVSVPEGLQTVASWAFANCPKLAECALPEGVRYATEPYREPGSEWNGQYLFSGCTSLASYRVPASLGGVSYGMFQNCTSLASVEIPEGIGYVGGSAFSNCRALSAISLPEGLTSVGGSAFHGCSPAAPVAIPASLTEVGDGAFRWYVTYSSHSEWDEAAGEWVERREYSTPESYELRPATWEQYWRLRSSRYVNPDTTEVVAPEGAEPGELEWEWVANADGTATVTGCSGGFPAILSIPSEVGGLPVAAIGDSAFEDAGWLEEAVLPAGLRSVGERAFYGCERLRRVSVPEGLQTVASWAFANCPKLAECALPEGVRYATEPYREPGSEWNGQYLFSGCTSLASYRVPASLGGVSYGMFQNCTSLASVEIPEGIGYVGGSAFSNCRALSAISLPEGLTSVGGSAFHGCSPAAPVAIPASLTEVGDGAFRWYVTYSSHSEWDEAAGEWVERREYSTPESYELRPATWEQYWRLRSSRYVNPDTTEVVAPEGAEPGELEWEWVANADGTITITGCKTSVRNLTIPATIGGKTVTCIGQGAFSDNKVLNSVVIPQTVVTIQSDAFANCTALSSVLVPDGVSSIGDGAFDGSQNAMLVCSEGSPAAQYAGDNGIPTTTTVPMSMALITCDAEVPYADGGARPRVMVKVGEKELSSTTDYTVSYTSNDHLGIAMVNVTARDGSGYEGTQYKSFKVVPASLSTATLSGVTDQSYTGKGMTPLPVVEMGGKTLTLGTDYTLSYANNVGPGTATVTVTGRGNYAGAKSATFLVSPSFLDVTRSTAHAGDIYWLAASGISSGFPDGTFRPGAGIARCDMAAFLFRLACRWGVADGGWQPTAAQKGAFSDVSGATAHAREVWWLASAGISSGFPDGTFRPGATIARCDMAAFLFRLAKMAGRGGAGGGWQPTAAQRGAFSDVSAPTAHAREVWWLASAGISSGFPDGTFRPGASIARCDMAAFLHRMDSLG